MIGGSTVLSAAKIQVIACALASFGSSPAWRCYMEHDRLRLEQGESAFLIGRDLTERLKRAVCGLLHRAERHKTNVVRLAHFFERSANGHVTRQLAAIRRAFKDGNGGGDLVGQRRLLLWRATLD